MTPVTGRVTNAQENRFLLRAGFGEGFIAPRKPIHWVVRVLEEVGDFSREAVGVFGVPVLLTGSA